MLLARTDRRSARRGAILLIVLTLIALFSVVGLSFALYAESQALGSRTRREAKAIDDAPPPAELYASAALGQMLYGEPIGTYGTGNNLLKTIRGHEDATMVYGDNPNGGNSVPYNGVGQFSDALSLPTATGGSVAIDRRDVINYSLQFPRLVNGNIVPNAIHVVDPSHSGFRNSTQVGVSPGNTTTFPTKAYVARNAPYTYPDRLNAKVAMQDPTTGRILVPSFHRPSLFGNLGPANPNWRDDTSVFGAGNPAGRYKILRPRPWDHRLPGETEDQSRFPFPPANPDGTITGDVQNIAQTDGRQQNDAVWVDMGLAPTTWRGRLIQPLVAATILPLDGRVNANVAGNISGGSTNGFGPWEIGLGKLTTDATTMVNNRTGGTTPSPRGSNVVTWPFAPSTTQSYAAVNWDGNTVATPMTYPSVNQSDPTYPVPGFDSATASNTEASSHPGQFLPYTWNAFSSPGKLFPHTDLRRSTVKYSGKPSDYFAPYFGPTAPGTLSGTGPGNASNRLRAQLTTASNSLQRPQLMPNFADPSAANLAYDSMSGQLVATPQTLTNLVVPGAVASDFGGALNLRHALAGLGAVNLNRPLADYRAAANPTNPLSPTNMMNVQAATNDRQTLARDIFVRLVVATGAKAIVNPTAGTIVLPRMVASSPNYDLLAPGDTLPAQYDALRYLAQLAANIVDTIDNDDIATQFVWNPTVASSLFGADGGNADMTANLAMASMNPTARTAYLQDRVVIGMEKPRVVINEVYSEVTNSPNDLSNMDAMEDFHVRFWIELINTSNTGGDATAPLGNGSVSLTYMGTSPYKIQVFRDGGQVRNALFNPATPGLVSNITGRVQGTGDQKIDAVLPSTTAYTIDPNNGQSGPGTTTGFRVIGPNLAGLMGTSATEFLPNTGAAPYLTGFIGTTNGSSPPAVGMSSPTLAYSEQRRQPMDIATMTMNRLTDQAVLLRRLANPYQAANDPLDSSYNGMLPPNPYVTVDAFTDVTSRDAIRVGERVTLPGSGMRPMGQPTPPNTRASKGRLAPHYAHRTPLTGGADTSGFVAQQTMPDTVSAPGGQHISFFNHNNQRNGGAAPAIEWLAHFDRPLVNQIELAVASALKPHELTYRFVSGTSLAPIAHQHVAPFANASVPLHRALEVLSIKPWGYGLPTEGRVPGKININMVWDQRVLEALLDENGSDTFTSIDVSNLYYNTMAPANSLIFGSGNQARSKNLTTFAPGNTVDETGLATDDRPFKSFGTAAFAPGGLLPSGSGLPFTLLRDGATPGTPAVYAAAGTHPYQRAEMLRKMFNNVTTTSDTYLVVMTVGFFEVRNTTFPISTANPLVLGREVSDQVAGDLRGKYVAIVDRSMLATDVTGTQQVDGYYQTTLSETPYQVGGMGAYYLRFAAQGTTPTGIQMNYEGRTINVPNGASFVVGTGANAETFTVAALGGMNPDGSAATTFNASTGLATVTLAAVPARLHHGGDSVSNGIHQNPGAQPAFDVNVPRYQGVVPYFEPVEIGK